MLLTFADRVTSFRTSLAFSDSDVVFAHDIPKWRFMKQQTMVSLKQHGDGLKRLEAKTLEYGEQMLQKMKDYNGKAFDPHDLICEAIAYIMMTLTYGEATQEDVNEFLKNEKEVHESFNPAGIYLMLDVFPFLRYVVPPLKRAFERFMHDLNRMKQIFDNFTNARRKQYRHPKTEVVIDHFFKLHEFNDMNNNIRINKTDVRSVGIDLLEAGTGTTTRTLHMMLGILVNHSHFQDKAYDEIVKVIGKRKPKIEDRPSMPFLEALITETLRYTSLFMLAIPHVSKCDAELNGYLIPKNTIIFVNLWSLHHDTRYWEKPWEFDPNRFIEDGKVVPPDHIKKQRLFPFGAGKRQCAGRVFARNRLFILTTMMLQKFKFLPAEGHPLPKHDPRDYFAEFTLNMKHYNLSVQLRNG